MDPQIESLNPSIEEGHCDSKKKYVTAPAEVTRRADAHLTMKKTEWKKEAERYGDATGSCIEGEETEGVNL